MNKLLAYFFFCSCLSSVFYPAYADLKLEHPECRTIILSDDGSWYFYAGEKYEFIDVKSLKDQSADFNAKLVRVSASAQTLIDNFFLTENRDDETPIEVNLELLDKLIKNKIIDKCNNGCDVIVKGIFSLDTTNNVNYKSIQAREIVIK